jgi:hypothetical protein
VSLHRATSGRRGSRAIGSGSSTVLTRRGGKTRSWPTRSGGPCWRGSGTVSSSPIERAHGHRDRIPDEVIACPHGHWSATWREFRKSYRNKHLGSAGLETFFRDFAARYPRARTYGEKMVLIDTLLHRYHWELEGDPGGPGATNLVGGTREEVIAFLNQLTYGEHTTPGLTETKAHWLRALHYGPWHAATVDELSARHPWPMDRADDT